MNVTLSNVNAAQGGPCIQQDVNAESLPLNQLPLATNMANYVNMSESELESGNFQNISDLKPAPQTNSQATSISRPTPPTNSNPVPGSNKENSKGESRFRIVKTDSDRKSDPSASSSAQPILTSNSVANNLTNTSTQLANATVPIAAQQSTNNRTAAIVSAPSSSYVRGRWRVVDYENGDSGIKQSQMNTTVSGK